MNNSWTRHKNRYGEVESAERDCPNIEKVGSVEIVRNPKGEGFISNYAETDNTEEGGGKHFIYEVDMDTFNDGSHPKDIEEAIKATDAWLKENGIS